MGHFMVEVLFFCFVLGLLELVFNKLCSCGICVLEWFNKLSFDWFLKTTWNWKRKLYK